MTVNNVDETEHREIRKTGSWMIIGGWLLAITILTLLFSGVITRQHNPNPTTVLNRQTDSLVLAANASGMYFADGYLNGTQVTFLLDTGATYVAVPQELAEAVGLVAGRQQLFTTANGVTSAWTTIIDTLQVGPLTLQNVKGVIVENLDGPVLLGMSALRGLQLTQKDNKLTISATP